MSNKVAATFHGADKEREDALAAALGRFLEEDDGSATDLRDAIAEAVARALADVARLPKWMQVPALGEHLGPVGDLAADAVLPVVEAWLAVRPVAAQERLARVEALADEWGQMPGVEPQLAARDLRRALTGDES